MKSLYNLTFLLFALFFSSQGYGQKVELIGTLIPDGMKPIALKLSFQVQKDGSLKGVSITDFYGANQTVSEIKGRLNLKTKRLSFQEINNLSTYSEADSGDFCYIQVKDLELDLDSDSALVQGDFEGAYADGSFCAKGQIHLLGAAYLENLIADATRNTTNTSAKDPEQEPPTNNAVHLSHVVDALDPNKPLVNGDQINLKWSSDTLKLELWDSFEEDGDRVDVYINGRKEISDFKVKERKASFLFIPGKGQVELEIVAVNEGSNPPCTVHAHLWDGDKLQATVVKLKKGESVALTLYKPWDYLHS